jgi:predicted transcriptional regulator
MKPKRYTKHLSLALTESQKAAVDEIARDMEMASSEFVRMAIEHAIKRWKK